MFESGSKEDTALKWLCAAAGGYLVTYTSGPLTGYLAQYLYTKGFYFLYGTPDPMWWWLSPNQWRGYINAGHVFNYAYDYGNAGLGLAAAPFFYTLPDLVRYCFTRKKPVNESDRAVVDKEIDRLVGLGQLLRRVPDAVVGVANEARPFLPSMESSSSPSASPPSSPLPLRDGTSVSAKDKFKKGVEEIKRRNKSPNH